MRSAFPKQLSFSLICAAALLGIACAAFLALSGRDPPLPAVAPSLERLDEVLERLDRLEAVLLALKDDLRSRPPPRASSVGSPSEEQEAAAGPPEGKWAPVIRGIKERKLLASSHQGAPGGELRGLVREVIQEEREERIREEERRREDEKREWDELGQGPYGKLNLRVNILGRRLNLDDFQRQRYFEVLTEYSGHLDEAVRSLDKKDPESLRAFEERRRGIQEEFEALVIQTLTPPQAKEYQSLPEYARSPGPEGTKALASLAAKSK